jgi:hypothetical protein
MEIKMGGQGIKCFSMGIALAPRPLEPLFKIPLTSAGNPLNQSADLEIINFFQYITLLNEV